MSRDLTTLPEGYETFLADLKQRIRTAQVRAALSVNRELILLYWSIGRDILNREQAQGWGAKVVNRLADDLSQSFPEVKGFGLRSLRYMRAFAEAYQDSQFVQQVVAQLPWGHHLRILDAVKEPDRREWYIRQAIDNGWSRNVLVHQIEGGSYSRQGRALTNFSRVLPAPESELAQQLIKDPYNFDFLALGPEMLERDLERGLIEHLRDFILELGKGFAFVGNQYHLGVGDQDFYLDLLFYHLRLRCYVVIDLKIEDFRPEFAGKMNFYLSVVDDQLRHPDDKPTIGIILCKGRNEVIVEYALRDTNKPMGVAQYQLTRELGLPDNLQGELPTSAELSREFPLLSVVKVRIEIERALNELAEEHGLSLRLLGVGQLVRELQMQGLLPESAKDLVRVMNAMNAAAHGVEVNGAGAHEAVRVGNTFLADLRSERQSGVKKQG